MKNLTIKQKIEEKIPELIQDCIAEYKEHPNRYNIDDVEDVEELITEVIHSKDFNDLQIKYDDVTVADLLDFIESHSWAGDFKYEGENDDFEEMLSSLFGFGTEYIFEDYIFKNKETYKKIVDAIFKGVK